MKRVLEPQAQYSSVYTMDHPDLTGSNLMECPRPQNC